MSYRGHIFKFGPQKAGLSTVSRAWVDSSKNVIGAWGGNVLELKNESGGNTGDYTIYESAPANSYWLACTTGEATPRYAVISIKANAFVFGFSPADTGKSVGYTFYDSSDIAIGSEITAGVTEYPAGSGIYIVYNSAVPTNAVFVRARTIEATPRRVSLSLDLDALANVYTSDGAIINTHLDDNVNIINSIRHHIENYQFNYNGATRTIPQRYANFNVGIGYPQNFNDIVPPKVTIELGPSTPRKTWTWTKSEKSIPVVIEGWCGKLKGGEANLKQMYNLMDDIVKIFDPEMGTRESINLLDFSTGSAGSRTVLDTLKIGEVVGQIIPMTGEDTLDILRYHFRVTMTVGLIKSQ